MIPRWIIGIILLVVGIPTIAAIGLGAVVLASWVTGL